MMPDLGVVELSRLQFAVTAMYHFLFVPLTLGLSFLLAIMESVYLMTRKVIYRDMTKFWGKLFGINFAMGVATGMPMEFQFGTNWAYYAHYVGDIFGVPLAIEGLMAFFLESTLVGLFFFGWGRLSRVQHLAVTWMLALSTSLSGLWILIANAWMQHPVGAEFHYETLRMELTNIADVILNPVAQVKFVHTVAAGYTTGAMFVLGISAYYLLQGRDIEFARRSFRVASGFGLASALSVIVLGDESGYTLGDVQKVKLAAIEAEWETQAPPASFTLFGFPNDREQRTDYQIKIPWLLGLVATRSIDTPVVGIKELLENHRQHMERGKVAYSALKQLREGDKSPGTRKLFEEHKQELGYGLLLKQYAPNVIDASPEQMDAAVRQSIPAVAPLFWTFRGMVLCGVLMLFVFAASFYFNARHTAHRQRWLLRLAMYCIPLPWIASELGWFVAEYGRQPWTIAGILPTAMSASNLSPGQVVTSLSGFVVFYSLLLGVELWLMFKFARLGPSSLHTGRYHYEQPHLAVVTQA